MKTLLAMTCLVLALWLLSHFYFCYYSIYYKTHVATTAIVEGVISFSYVRSPVLSPLMADSGIMMFEGNEGILPTIFPAFKITGLAPGLNLEDGLRIGIPFWLLFLLLLIGFFRKGTSLWSAETMAPPQLRPNSSRDGKASPAIS